MADELPSLHIDNDWKKQAQEEKRKLAEQAAKTPAVTTAAASAPVAGAVGASRGAAAAVSGRRLRELPVPSFASMVQAMMTQVLYYLGDLATAGAAPAVDLDMAKHHLDTLGVLEDKTKNNLTAEEQTLLDAALYETRARFISVASQYLGP